jgi:predicted extracellular nuclease
VLASGLPVVANAAHAVAGPTSPIFVNEIHYDDDGTDAGEFVEVVVPAGTDVTGWSLVLYNANPATAATTYSTRALSEGQATPGFVVLDYPVNGLQNGSNDGLALVDAAGDVVQLLSYEGAFTAANGLAAGDSSTDIGRAETGSEPDGMSLQLTGSGTAYGDFRWAAPAAASKGAVNGGQTIQPGSGTATPTASCPESLDAGVDRSASTPVTATDLDSRVVTASLTAPPSGVSLQSFTASGAVGSPATATLTVTADTAPGTYPVEVVFGTDDVPAQTARCTVAVGVSDPSRVTPVHEVQGAATASPLVGQPVTIDAVVTAVITSRDAVDGVYVQERVPDGDADTSEGIYVYCRTLCPRLAAGDLVRVTGAVDEHEGTTRIAANASGTAVTVLASGWELPAAAVVTLPADGSTTDPATFERLEGMRTTISTTLAVAEYYDQAQFGEIVLEAGQRSYQYTQLNAPSSAGYEAFLADLATRRIVLDDASNDRNDATSGSLDNEPYYYPTPGLSTGNRFRGGDTITGLTGVLEYSFDSWRLRPVAGADYTFSSVNPRPAGPDAVGGRLQVASFNVLNYFAAVDTTSSNNTGTCGPAGTADCRGADSQAERVRQLDKIVAALAMIRADIFGLIEIQNDSGRATQQIVDALNARVGAGTYAYLDTGVIGTDAIKQAFVYDTTSIAPVGDFDLLTTADDPRFLDTRNRPSLIQTFEEVLTGERLTVSVNHFKSKGSGCGTGDDSRLDGSGSCDSTRTAAAQALVDHLAADPTGSGDPDFLVIGDLNSYAQERPITTIEGAGYTNLLRQFEGEDSYGYLFDGLLGDLDHALASASLLPQVTGAGGWDINADENPLFDYDDGVRDTGEAAFERKSDALPLYEASPYRSSDHDPAIVGLALASPNRAPVADIGGPYCVRVGRTVVLAAGRSRDPDRLDGLSYAWDLDGDGQFDDARGATVTYRGTRGPFPREVAVEVTDGVLSSVAHATVVVTGR